jgi:hypothetical protein
MLGLLAKTTPGRVLMALHAELVNSADREATKEGLFDDRALTDLLKRRKTGTTRRGFLFVSASVTVRTAVQALFMWELTQKGQRAPHAVAVNGAHLF